MIQLFRVIGYNAFLFLASLLRGLPQFLGLEASPANLNGTEKLEAFKSRQDSLHLLGFTLTIRHTHRLYAFLKEVCSGSYHIGKIELKTLVKLRSAVSLNEL